MTKPSAPNFCALCTADIPAGQERGAPLGRGNAIVIICASCADDPAVEKRGPERAYEGAGPSMRAGEITTALRRAQGEERYRAESEAASRYGQSPAAPMSKGDQDWLIYSRENVRLRATGSTRKNGVRQKVKQADRVIVKPRRARRAK